MEDFFLQFVSHVGAAVAISATVAWFLWKKTEQQGKDLLELTKHEADCKARLELTNRRIERLENKVRNGGR